MELSLAIPVDLPTSHKQQKRLINIAADNYPTIGANLLLAQ